LGIGPNPQSPIPNPQGLLIYKAIYYYINMSNMSNTSNTSNIKKYHIY